MPGSAWVEAGARVVPGRAGGWRCGEEVVLIPAINGRPVISRDDMAALGCHSWFSLSWAATAGEAPLLSLMRQ
jgi:hypothetical protein